MSVKAIPEGYHSVTPYLIVRNGAAALEFYKNAFGAVEIMRMPGPDGCIAHAEFKIGNSHLMLSDEMPGMGYSAPESLGGSPIQLMVYLENVDEVYPRALAAGGKEERPLQDQFYGDRSGTLKDPFGHTWTLSTHVEDVSEEEMNKRLAEMMSKGECG